MAMAGLTPPAPTRTWVTSRSRNRSHSSEVAPPVHGVGGVEMAVGVLAGHTAEQRTGTDQPAVEVDRRHLRGPRIAADIEHVDVMDQLGHQHGRGFRVVRCEGGLRRSGSGPTYGPSVVAPAGTAMLPVPPTAEFDAEVVPAAVVGMP